MVSYLCLGRIKVFNRNRGANYRASIVRVTLRLITIYLRPETEVKKETYFSEELLLLSPVDRPKVVSSRLKKLLRRMNRKLIFVLFLIIIVGGIVGTYSLFLTEERNGSPYEQNIKEIIESGEFECHGEYRKTYGKEQTRAQFDLWKKRDKVKVNLGDNLSFIQKGDNFYTKKDGNEWSGPIKVPQIPENLSSEDKLLKMAKYNQKDFCKKSSISEEVFSIERPQENLSFGWKFVKKVGSFSSENFNFSSITDVSFGPDGKLYLTDEGESGFLEEKPGKIHLFDESIKYEKTLSCGNGLDCKHQKMEDPQEIEIDSDGNIYISDNSSIYKFNRERELVFVTSNDSPFFWMGDVEVTEDYILVVSSRIPEKIHLFNKYSGEYERTFGVCNVSKSEISLRYSGQCSGNNEFYSISGIELKNGKYMLWMIE